MVITKNSVYIIRVQLLRKWPKCYYKKYIGQKLEKGADEITYYMLLNGKGTFNGFIEDRNISKRTNKYKELKMTFKKIVGKALSYTSKNNRFKICPG
ncbi:unnamed protein product [Rhizophagus irregularis]|nr:unnamed protein product [Rhizophagus irregularis]